MLKTAAMLTLLGAAEAHAASMEYCQLYSRAYVEASVRTGTEPAKDLAFALRQSYAKCLNSDDDPQVDAGTDEEFLARFRPGPSGFIQGSPGWRAWCSKNYRSFDAETGLVVKGRKREKTLCPG